MKPLPMELGTTFQGMDRSFIAEILLYGVRGLTCVQYNTIDQGFSLMCKIWYSKVIFIFVFVVLMGLPVANLIKINQTFISS